MNKILNLNWYIPSMVMFILNIERIRSGVPSVGSDGRACWGRSDAIVPISSHLFGTMSGAVAFGCFEHNFVLGQRRIRKSVIRNGIAGLLSYCIEPAISRQAHLLHPPSACSYAWKRSNSPHHSMASLQKRSLATHTLSTTTSLLLSSQFEQHQRELSSHDRSFRNEDVNWGVITSAKSNVVKKFRYLISQPRRRREANMTVLEGYRLIADLLANPRTSHLIQHVIIQNREVEKEEEANYDFYDDNVDNKRNPQFLWHKVVALLRTQQHCKHIEVHWGTIDVINACSDTVTPQGIVALCSVPLPFDPPTKKEQKLKNYKFYLILDGVSDPGNVGTLLRSAVATGVSAVVLLHNSCDVWSPKAIRSSMGASFQIPIRIVSSLRECLNLLSDCNVSTGNVFAATMKIADPDITKFNASGENVLTMIKRRRTSTEHYSVDWTVGDGSAICIGGESYGLSDEVRSAISSGQIIPVHIPMAKGIESLNAAICGSVIMFEYFRQSMTHTATANTKS